MSYAQIEITEVGPAEYPLIAVLRDTIFRPFGHRYSATFEEGIEGRQDVLALMAHLEGNPVGYKVGFREGPRRYYSWTGGVLPDYRGQGVAARMQAWQHAWLRARGYHTVEFTTFNKFRSMMRFGLAGGFVPEGVSIRPENELAIRFRKDLRQPDPPPRAKAAASAAAGPAVHVEAVGPNYHGLIAQLATDTVLKTSEEQVDRAMAAGPDALALVAFVDNQPVGFKTGWGRDPMRFYYHSHMGGVLPEFRGMGVATALARHQVRAIAGMGYRKVGYFTRHDNVPMLRMALGLGFDVIGMQFSTQAGFAQVMLERAVTPADRE